MPRVNWNENSMRYSMCFFPLVGAVIGICQLGLLYLLGYRLAFGTAVSAVCLTVLPVLLTGGIHLDGYLDTVDARSSCGSQEEKLRILKDPHTGAFAIIYGIVYMLLYAGFMYELVSVSMSAWQKPAGMGFLDINKDPVCAGYLVMALAYVYIRILSGLSVVTFRKARKDGMAATTAASSDKTVGWILALELVLCIAGMIMIHPLYGMVAAVVGFIVFGYYRYVSYKFFGGVTGDIAGYFLQVAELSVLIAIVLMQHIA